MAAKHPDYQTLESYVLGRLKADKRAVSAIDEHLLVCGACVNRAEDALEFATLIRAALRLTVPKTITASALNT
jgi:hypothetical protein